VPLGRFFDRHFHARLRRIARARWATRTRLRREAIEWLMHLMLPIVVCCLHSILS